jgi:hypothetical protein
MVDSGSTNVARGLGWGPFLAGFVPGLLQYWLGNKKQAAIAFVGCTVLFFAGWLIVGERLFYWALIEPRADGSELLRGLAVTLRFARVKGYRSDKRVDEADTIDAVRALLPE